MVDLFKDILPSIMVNKRYQFNDAEAEKIYNPFAINRALSYHPDCLYYANQANMMMNIPKKAQYLFLLHSIRGKKRPFSPWVKQVKEVNLQAIKTFFQYSDKKAIEALKVLTEEQVAEICQKVNAVE